MSDWAGIKKAINSDLSSPLNHLMWLNDYRIFGEESYVFQNKDILHELYEDYKLCMNAKPIQTETFAYVVTNNTEVGKALAGCKGITDADILAELTTVDVVVSNTRAMTAVAANETAMTVMVNNPTTMLAMVGKTSVMSVIANSEVAMKVVSADEQMLNEIIKSTEMTNVILSAETGRSAIFNSSLAMNLFLDNETFRSTLVHSGDYMEDVSDALTAMELITRHPATVVEIAKTTSEWSTSVKKKFFTAVCATKALVVNIYNILLDSTYFNQKTHTYYSYPPSADTYGTAEYMANGLIACALGQNGSSSNSTSMLIDGELIIESNEYSCPNVVSSEQVNAIGCPTATFTAKGNGYMAIEVYIAK